MLGMPPSKDELPKNESSMTTKTMHGVIAAIATAVDPSGEPDSARSVALARFLLDNGCDGLNVLGTTGEATSFSLEQRKRVMSAYAASGLPLDRMMVGTGAAEHDELGLVHHGFRQRDGVFCCRNASDGSGT